jgi:outer membrane immunogenic protein
MRGKVVGLISTAVLSFSLAAAASAADLAVKAPVYKAPVALLPFSWTGCYVGVEGGGIWGRSKHTDVTSPNPNDVGLPITNDFNLSGGLAGGTVGCNYQISNWVFGVENDISWTDAKGSANDLAPFTTTTVSQTREKWLDTVRGRVGFAWDRALFYGTGGAAFAGTAVQVCGTLNCVNETKTRTGWVAGAGVEYAVWKNVTLKVEYLHADFGTSRYIDPPVVIGGATFNTRDVPLTNDIVRAGVNYKF